MASKANNRIVLRSNPKYKRDGLKSYGAALRKYGFKPTVAGPFDVVEGKHQTKAGEKRQMVVKKDANGTVGEVSSEDIQNDSEYLTDVGIGTPAQVLLLDFDTGSSDLWVWSTELSAQIQNEGEQAGHTIFNAANSSTWQNLSGETFQIGYGDGSSVSGNVGRDTINIGGVVVQNQAVERAEQMSSQFVQSSGDGLLGLAWPSINTVSPTQVATPVENMISQGDISQPLFTAYLTTWRDANDANQGDSFFTFGFIDQDIVDAAPGAEISYAAVDNSQGFWQFESTSASVNGETITRSGNTAIADTGTTLALVSDSLCQSIYGAIPGAQLSQEQQGWVFPSDTTAANLPVVQVAVGSQLFTIQKEDLGFANAGNGMVYGGIQSRGNMSFDILGDIFLKNVYAIFDQGNQRFGALQRQETTQNLEAPNDSTDQSNAHQWSR